MSTIGLIEHEDILLDLASLALSHLDHDNADIAASLAREALGSTRPVPL